MNVAEQLARAFDTLTDRVRDDLNGRFQSIKAELDSALQTVVDEARREAAAEAEARARGEADERAKQLEAQARDQLDQAAAHTAAQVTEQVEQATARVAADAEARHAEREASLTARHRAELERLVDAIRALDRSRSLTETLDVLIACATREAPRAAVFMVRDGRLRRLRAVGFGSAVDDAQDFTVAGEDAGILDEAMRTAALTPLGSGRKAPAFAAIGPDAPAVAAPLVIGGKVMAVLYGDQAANQSDAERTDPSTLERRFDLLARHASRSLEALTALQTARAATPAPSGHAAAAADAELVTKGGEA